MQSVFYNFLNYFCLTLFFIFLDCFNILISKIIFKIKNIILLYFKDKNTLKNKYYYTLEYSFNLLSSQNRSS
jgi:hypothetical protein